MLSIAPDQTRDTPRSCTARQRLREATAGLHGEVDGLFPDGLDSLHAYRRYVLGMHRFAVDHEVVVGAVPRLSACLAHDLVALSLPPLPATGTCRRAGDRWLRLGWDYVMSGSSLGARMLLRDVRRLGLEGTDGARFLERHAAGDDWPRLLARLEAIDSDDTRRMAAIETGAREAFALVRTCFARSFEALPVNHTTRTTRAPSD